MVKCLLILISALVAWPVVMAQDLIVLRNGDIIKAKVQKIGSTEVEYRKYSNPDGPLYGIEKSDILAINYENGEKDTFDSAKLSDKDAKASSQSQQEPIVAGEDNLWLLQSYNQTLEYSGKQSSGYTNKAFVKWAFTENSVISTDEFEISIEWLPETEKTFPCCVRTIFIRNKTASPLYVDMGNTFRVSSYGESKIYYDESKAVLESNGVGSGGGFNLGGVTSALGIGGAIGSLAGATSVGGGKTHSVSKNISQSRFVVIPPRAKKAISQHKHVKEKSDNYNVVSHAEDLRTDKLKKGYLKKGEIKRFFEQDSPLVFNYQIAISNVADFSSYKLVPFSLYVQQIIGDVGGMAFNFDIKYDNKNVDIVGIYGTYKDDDYVVKMAKTKKKMKELFPNITDKDIVIGIILN